MQLPGWDEKEMAIHILNELDTMGIRCFKDPCAYMEMFRVEKSPAGVFLSFFVNPDYMAGFECEFVL